MPIASEVQTMFSAIAPRYDTLNRILSLGTDRAWRRRCCDALEVTPDDLAADLCCGTGDLALALAGRGATVIAADFSREMLAIANAKGVGRLAEADCLRLPFAGESFSLVTVAFGVRNLADLEGGLREMRRVLRPGGRLGILEFARPRGTLFSRIYGAYLRWAVPVIGAAVSGRRSAYRYLADSIRHFPDQQGMMALMRRIGFTSVRHIDFVRGVAALYIGIRPASSGSTSHQQGHERLL
ncbi:MAG: bifunctional demethylmenaquinone methyltransferase/2-methoxy-6-polyprenyl-1,4-benzoquinol methylase UbiE [Acidobacteriota bacterium]